ncbi:MAG: hypothetical protein PUF38_03995 [Bacteroidales bacterium]|nr:hypothetical protein [Bacteroidales bacterium]
MSHAPCRLALPGVRASALLSASLPVHPPFSLLEARAALQAKATRLRRNFIIATVPADSVGGQAKANLNLFSP